MPTNLYTSLDASYGQALTTGVTGAVQGAIQANADILAGAMTIFVIGIGVMTAFGRMSMPEFSFAVIRAGAVSVVLTAWGFSTFIQQPIMDDIPNFIASSTTGSFGGRMGAQQFDALRDAVVAREARILQQATGLFYIGAQLRAWAMTLAACIEISVSFFIWMVARGMIGLLVAVGPSLIIFYLFATTRHITLNWAGAVVSMLLLMLLLSTLLSISMTANAQFEAQQATAGEIEVQLDILMNIVLFFFVAMMFTIFLPVVASRIGHGIAPDVRSILMTPMQTMRSTRDFVSRRMNRRG